jgi:hypothetical protein
MADPINGAPRRTLSPLPSIVDLGRYAHANDAAIGRLYEATSKEPDTDEHKALLFDRADALRKLLLTSRAVTLGDAATQLYVGWLVSEEMHGFDLPKGDLQRCCLALRRVFLSTLPVVAAAASLDLAQLGSDPIADYAAREFPAEG